MENNINYSNLIKYCSTFEKLAKKKSSGKWKKLPKGWKPKSVKKLYKSLVGGKKHPVTSCMKKMEDKMDNPAAFCASLQDKVKGKSWRSQ